MNQILKETCSIVGITGTPGTGKKSVGRIVSDLLGCRFLDLNTLAFESKAVKNVNNEDYEVSPDKLRKYVLHQINDGDVVMIGHLLPYILSKGEVDFVAVLRCSPFELEKRYAKRGYSASKIRDNVGSEILDICFTDALNRFGAEVLAEFDTTGRSPQDVAEDVILVQKGLKKRFLGEINWFSDLSSRKLIKKYFR